MAVSKAFGRSAVREPRWRSPDPRPRQSWRRRPVRDTQDTLRPITRTVADAARVLDVVAGYDPADPISARGADHIPADGYVSHLTTDGVEGARLGVVRELFGVRDTESAPASAADAVTRVINAVLDEMAAAGTSVVDPVEIIDFEDLESARVLAHEFCRDFDAYLTDLTEAPYRSLAEIVATGEVVSSVEVRLRDEGILNVDDPDADGDYLQRLRRRQRVQRERERFSAG